MTTSPRPLVLASPPDAMLGGGALVALGVGAFALWLIWSDTAGTVHFSRRKQKRKARWKPR